MPEPLSNPPSLYCGSKAREVRAFPFPASDDNTTFAVEPIVNPAAVVLIPLPGATLSGVRVLLNTMPLSLTRISAPVKVSSSAVLNSVAETANDHV